MSLSQEMLTTVRKVIEAELIYEDQTGCGRKFGITGEVGEILVCHVLRLKLVRDPRSEGFDAVDALNLRIQIKTRRGEDTELPKDTGRLSRFSNHPFDYALMGILDRQYELVEVWKADSSALQPVIEKHKRRNPTIHQFKASGVLVYQRGE